MPGSEKNLRKAARITDAQKKIDAAKAELEAARQDHEQARKALEKAAPAGKPAAEEVVAEKDEKLQGAQEELDLLQRQLEMLLECGEGTSGWRYFLANAMSIGFFLLSIAVIVFLMGGITVGSLLSDLSATATARGLITFLIAVITVSIALILVLSTVVSESSSDREKRFLQGKEVLTMLIGVLGTIVGFYFGHSLDEPSPLLIGPTSIKKVGDKLQLVAYVSGGKSPYTYDISFTPKEIPAVKNETARDGLIIAEVAAPNVADNSEVAFEIVVKDNLGKTRTHKGKERLSAKVEGGDKKDGK
jgi:hypothetical protein